MTRGAGGHEYEPPPAEDLDRLGRVLAAGLTATTVQAAGQAALLPTEVHRALVRLAGAMAAGDDVAFAPAGRTLALHEGAADLGLGLVAMRRLVRSGDLPVTYVDGRPRLRPHDLQAFRARRRDARYAALAATAVDLADESDVDDTTLRLLEARKVVAGRRASRRRQGLEA